jgi:hypothetical protein
MPESPVPVLASPPDDVPPPSDAGLWLVPIPEPPLPVIDVDVEPLAPTPTGGAVVDAQEATANAAATAAEKLDRSKSKALRLT